MKKYLKEFLSSNQSVVDTRHVVGTLLLIFCCVLTWLKEPQMVDILIYTACALLGIGTLSDIFKKKDDNNEKPS